jgi:hypothetical protein
MLPCLAPGARVCPTPRARNRSNTCATLRTSRNHGATGAPHAIVMPRCGPRRARRAPFYRCRGRCLFAFQKPTNGDHRHRRPRALRLTRGDRVGEARELGLKAELFAQASAVHHRVEGARALRVRAVGAWVADGREERGEVGGFVIGHVLAFDLAPEGREALALPAFEGAATASSTSTTRCRFWAAEGLSETASSGRDASLDAGEQHTAWARVRGRSSLARM